MGWPLRSSAVRPLPLKALDRRCSPTSCSALGGTLWYFQFVFYTMGESQMGRFGFSSWTLHMASIIIFGTLWGFALREWRDAATSIRATVWAGVALLVLATVIIGYGNSLAS
ncbi:L-rhamnose-proton symport protein RhaT [Sphingomonas sp. PP-CE-1G-424]|nr:L-rhamnose-proton symport protein RhaT [Sphingomonas sp. PP-CE-1G-424]